MANSNAEGRRGEQLAQINVCRECDATYADVELGRAEIARCRNCRAVVARHPGVWALGALTILLAVLGRFDPSSWWALEHRAKTR